jgi:hypothetical protein
MINLHSLNSWSSQKHDKVWAGLAPQLHSPCWCLHLPQGRNVLSLKNKSLFRVILPCFYYPRITKFTALNCWFIMSETNSKVNNLTQLRVKQELRRILGQKSQGEYWRWSKINHFELECFRIDSICAKLKIFITVK